MTLRVLLVALIAFALAAPRVNSAMLGSYLSIGLIALLAILASLTALIAYGSRRPRSVWIASLLIAISLWIASFSWGGYAMLYGKTPLVQASSGPIAVAIVIDTSPSMDYRAVNKTRLEVAKEMGAWLIGTLAPESQIAIVTTEQGLRLSPDRVTAERQLSRVTLEGKASPLPSRIEAAMELVRNSKLERREVYVLTDMVATPWQGSTNDSLTSSLLKQPSVLLQVIDVGVEKAQNWSLVETKLSQQLVSPGGSVEIEATVVASPQSPAQQVPVELWTEPIDNTKPIQRNGKTIVPTPKAHAEQKVELQPGSESKVRFTLRDLKEPGTYQVQLRIGMPDPLQIDNVSYATIDVHERGKVLVVCDDKEIARQIMAFVDLASAVEGKSNRVDRADTFRWDTISFEQYTSIVVSDPSGLSPQVVEKLSNFVDAGGGLLLLLGPRLGDANKIQSSPIAKLLPGEIVRLASGGMAQRKTFFSPSILAHPILHPLDNSAELAPWSLYPIMSYWEFDKLNDRSSVVVRYTSSSKPAIIDEARGTGRIVTWTTPFPEPANPPGRDPWNQLWNGTDDPWPSWAVMLGSLRYLSGWGKYQLNYLVGQTASLENIPGVDPDRYELFAPDDEVTRIASNSNSLNIAYTKRSGAYRLRGVGKGENSVRGFAVNIAKQDLMLDRMEIEALDKILGKSQYRVAKRKEDVESSVGQARFGSELYPFLMVVVAFVVLAEQAMSSRFYSIRF